jgi:hypothetical protein
MASIWLVVSNALAARAASTVSLRKALWLVVKEIPATRAAATVSLMVAISWRLEISHCHSSADVATPGTSINS